MRAWHRGNHLEDLSLHILDIAENSTKAGATLIEIQVIEERDRNKLTISIKDNGRGMSKESLETVKSPYMTTRTTRKFGLGLSLLDQAVQQANGTLSVNSTLGTGTEVTATFMLNHIDRKPVGDIAATMTSLIAGNPYIDFTYHSNLDGKTIDVDTREIRRELDGMFIAHPSVLALIRKLFE